MTPPPSSAQQGQSTTIPRVAAAARIVRADSAASSMPLAESRILGGVDPQYLCCGAPRIPAAPARPIPAAAACERAEIPLGRPFSSSLDTSFTSIFDEFDDGRSKVISERIARLHGESPKTASGEIDFVAQWPDMGSCGDEYWEFLLKQAAFRLRREARQVVDRDADAARLEEWLKKTIRGEPKRSIPNLAAMLNMIDAQLPRIVGYIRHLPLPERDARARSLGLRLIAFKSLDLCIGVTRTVHFVELLKEQCPEADHQRFRMHSPP